MMQSLNMSGTIYFDHNATTPLDPQVREAMQPHTPEWHRLAALPATPAFPDVRSRPAPTPEGWPLFKVAPKRYAEFADARTIVGLNARAVREAMFLHGKPADRPC